MKASNFFTAFFLLLGFSALAQPGKIVFNETTHDFGKVYKGAPTEFNFQFTNVSDKSVQLKSVKASCGCTTPKWSNEEIKPDAKGNIEVKYDSYRVGQFTKQITVMLSDSTQQPILLTIKGEVQDTSEAARIRDEVKPKKLMADYKFPQGDLEFDKVVEELGVIDTDKNKTVKFMVHNKGNVAITMNTGANTDNSVSAIYFPKVLMSGQEGYIEVTVDGTKADAAGIFSKKLSIETNDPAGAVKELTLNGNFNKVMSEKEKAEAPNIQFSAVEYTAQNVIAGEKVVHAYKFTNTGKSDLVLEYAKGSCGCTVAELKEKVVKPGQTSEINATFDSTGRVGENVKTITVKSNDPDQEVVTLKLTVKVEADPFHAEDAGPSAKPAGSH